MKKNYRFAPPFLNCGSAGQIEKCAEVISSFNSSEPMTMDFAARWAIEGTRKVTLVSDCLCGYECRYNCSHARKEEICNNLGLLKSITANNLIVAACPEVLAGLPTPRPACEGQINGKVFSADGADYTEQFSLGAQKVLQMAYVYGAREFIGKFGSPSCGVGKIYDGTFSGATIPGDGVTAALLKAHGLKVSCL
ncbi:MAG: DUF523 domain-containing protein [Proteobacteria bacterium]|nr:DUF523 domain-containing protein [Pseudomonadota bacterium]